MATNFSTIGGVVTRGETYAKMMHHIREAQDCAAVMSHLHNTEGNDADSLLAKGWLGVSEMLKMMQFQLTELAKKSIQ